MNTKPILLLALALSAAQVRAEPPRLSPEWRDQAMRLAQLSEEERQRMRQQWQAMEPEDRARLRREFQHRMQSLPPEERERQRREIMERWRDRAGPNAGSDGERRRERLREVQENRQMWADEASGPGFGRGYERREMQREQRGR